MIEIIPTILVQTFDEVKDRIKLVEKYVKWVQIDVIDGIFVENKTWPYYAKASQGKLNPEDLKNFKTKVRLEAHLMVNKPEKVIDDWLEFVDRIIIHYEASKNIKKIIEKVHNKKRQIGIALNPETHPAVLEPFLSDLDLVLLMSVQPGRGGQEIKEWVLEKVGFLKQKKFKGDIEIDGGINNENIKKVVKAGVNLICVGSFIYRSKNIKQTINNLKI